MIKIKNKYLYLFFTLSIIILSYSSFAEYSLNDFNENNYFSLYKCDKDNDGSYQIYDINNDDSCETINEPFYLDFFDNDPVLNNNITLNNNNNYNFKIENVENYKNFVEKRNKLIENIENKDSNNILTFTSDTIENIENQVFDKNYNFLDSSYYYEQIENLKNINKNFDLNILNLEEELIEKLKENSKEIPLTIQIIISQNPVPKYCLILNKNNQYTIKYWESLNYKTCDINTTEITTTLNEIDYQNLFCDKDKDNFYEKILIENEKDNFNFDIIENNCLISNDNNIELDLFDENLKINNQTKYFIKVDMDNLDCQIEKNINENFNYTYLSNQYSTNLLFEKKDNIELCKNNYFYIKNSVFDQNLEYIKSDEDVYNLIANETIENLINFEFSFKTYNTQKEAYEEIVKYLEENNINYILSNTEKLENNSNIEPKKNETTLIENTFNNSTSNITSNITNQTNQKTEIILKEKTFEDIKSIFLKEKETIINNTIKIKTVNNIIEDKENIKNKINEEINKETDTEKKQKLAEINEILENSENNLQKETINVEKVENYTKINLKYDKKNLKNNLDNLTLIQNIDKSIIKSASQIVYDKNKYYMEILIDDPLIMWHFIENIPEEQEDVEVEFFIDEEIEEMDENQIETIVIESTPLLTQKNDTIIEDIINENTTKNTTKNTTIITETINDNEKITETNPATIQEKEDILSIIFAITIIPIIIFLLVFFEKYKKKEKYYNKIYENNNNYYNTQDQYNSNFSKPVNKNSKLNINDNQKKQLYDAINKLNR